ncbi:MAG: hypothetical protein JW779_04340 [Candidatus Thorarchaeota archaeon]|nr:hypothetical protein [Candidatus Thorarchaeota archaeon]
MDSAGTKQVYIESLSAMKKSLESSYELRVLVEDESHILEGLDKKNGDYIRFAGYLRNEGRRRFNDITEVINQALAEIGCCNSVEASKIYLETLKAVLLQSRWTQLLEMFSKYHK